MGDLLGMRMYSISCGTISSSHSPLMKRLRRAVSMDDSYSVGKDRHCISPGESSPRVALRPRAVTRNSSPLPPPCRQPETRWLGTVVGRPKGAATIKGGIIMIKQIAAALLAFALA